jgi:SAM-dependent methyltransferase
VNLFHMLHRRDANLRTEGDVVLAKETVAGASWRGLGLRAGGAFTIPDVRRFASFRAFPDSCGWWVRTPLMLAVKLSFRAHGSTEQLASRVFRGRFQPLSLPWPKDYFGAVDLDVEVVGTGRGTVFVANHRALSRDWLLALAVGKGVEIGPGPQPQVLPREGVDVSYVEQMRPAEWNDIYNKSGKFPVRPELWGNYIVAEASDLPVPDGSFDFIFGSHVFEHLANPIGHLERWRTKLAPGGRIICIVPDFAGTKDAVQERSTLAEWIEEYEAAEWLPSARHYVRHLKRAVNHPDVSNAMQRNQSIHAHYYDNINCQTLLQLAVDRLGYENYVIEHTPNHKDFHFVLRAP